MNVLVVGGSGRVGRLILPFMKDQHRLTVFDLVPPGDDQLDYLAGDVNDAAAVTRAMSGVDALIYMVIPSRSQLRELQISQDLNVKGLHQVLHCAAEAGIRRVVHASTLTVHHGREFYSSEDLPRDSCGVYGFTKGLGEQVCEWFCQVHQMAIVALRLISPRSRQEWLIERGSGGPGIAHTQDSDVAAAFLSALTCQTTGFKTVFISGDYQGKRVDLTGAREFLGWEPLARPV